MTELQIIIIKGGSDLFTKTFFQKIIWVNDLLKDETCVSKHLSNAETKEEVTVSDFSWRMESFKKFRLFDAVMLVRSILTFSDNTMWHTRYYKIPLLY